RGRVLRGAARGVRDRSRPGPQPRGVDALLLRHQGRARGVRPPGGRSAPLRDRSARGVASAVGDPRPVHRDRLREGDRGLPRGPGAPARRPARRRVTRADRLEALLRERELDALVVTNLVNVRYLSGYTGTNGVCVVGDGRRVFLTDFRYVTQAAREVDGFDREQGRQDLLEDAATHLSGRVGFEDFSMTVRQHERLSGFAPDGVELVPAGRLVEELRTVKDAGELDDIRSAAALADEVLAGVPERGLAGRAEREVALELENEMRRRGSDPSFPSIVAGGANGALPHARPGEDAIASDTLVVVDLGCVVDAYCSDCTRTFATVTVPESAAAVYDVVLQTQGAAVVEVAAGADGTDG